MLRYRRRVKYSPMPAVRNPDRLITSVNIPVRVYDEFVSRTSAKRTAQESLGRLVAWFNSLPVDAQEAILSRMTAASKVMVLKEAIRQLQPRPRKRKKKMPPGGVRAAQGE